MLDTTKDALVVYGDIKNDRMEESAKHGFTNATDAAVVNHGVSFRDATGIVGQLVLLCL